jgi:hypothetical protein
MRVRDTVFDSWAEREIFQELDSRLNPRLRLMAQMPLRSLIEIDEATKRKMRPSQWQYFLKAAVDYTFVYPDGRPLLSIEFDGVGGGFSHGRDYVPSRSTSYKNRVWTIRFKLRAAARAYFPLFVISGEEVAHLDEATSLAIVDGIVGQIFSAREERRLVEELLEHDGALISTMERAQADEYLQDLVFQAGVISDLKFDALAIAVADERQRCMNRFGFGSGGFHKPWLYDPPLTDFSGAPSSDQIHRRAQAMKSARRVGAHVGVAIGNGRYVDATA